MTEDARRFDIICLSDAPFDYPLWTNKQHVMSRLAKLGHRILYVDPQLGLVGWFKWYRAGRLKFRDLFWWVKRRNKNLLVFSPILFPPRYYIGRKINNFLRLKGILLLAKLLKFSQPILWIYHPDAVYFTGKIREDLIVYDCVDEYSTFPAYANPIRKQEIIANEKKLLGLADIVFTTSRPLFEVKRQFNPHTHLVQNVGDAEHFGKALLEDTEVPEEMKSLARPIVGFIGALDSYKIDFGLIEFVATNKPDWSVVLIGPVGEGDHTTTVNKLKEMGNVYFLGIKPYRFLPNYIKGFDVCMLPYNINEYTKYCFPLKIYEFLATGKPVVVTDLPSFKDLANVLRIAKDYQQFLEFLSEAISEKDGNSLKKRLEVAEKNSWDQRVRQLLSMIQQNIDRL